MAVTTEPTPESEYVGDPDDFEDDTYGTEDCACELCVYYDDEEGN